MLNGVGGSTIAEAKATLSYAEVLAWVAYRDKHGSLSLSRGLNLQLGLSPCKSTGVVEARRIYMTSYRTMPGRGAILSRQ